MSLSILPVGFALILFIFRDYSENFQWQILLAQKVNASLAEYIYGPAVIKIFNHGSRFFQTFSNAVKENVNFSIGWWRQIAYWAQGPLGGGKKLSFVTISSGSFPKTTIPLWWSGQPSVWRGTPENHAWPGRLQQKCTKKEDKKSAPLGAVIGDIAGSIWVSKLWKEDGVSLDDWQMFFHRWSRNVDCCRKSNDGKRTIFF